MQISSSIVFMSFLFTAPFLYQYVRQTFDGFVPEEMIVGQNVLVCGASYGIGEQMAYKYAKWGANIAILARTRKQLERVAKKVIELGASSVHVIDVDVKNEEGSRFAE